MILGINLILRPRESDFWLLRDPWNMYWHKRDSWTNDFCGKQLRSFYSSFINKSHLKPRRFEEGPMKMHYNAVNVQPLSCRGVTYGHGLTWSLIFTHAHCTCMVTDLLVFLEVNCGTVCTLIKGRVRRRHVYSLTHMRIDVLMWSWTFAKTLMVLLLPSIQEKESSKSRHWKNLTLWMSLRRGESRLLVLWRNWKKG